MRRRTNSPRLIRWRGPMNSSPISGDACPIAAGSRVRRRGLGLWIWSRVVGSLIARPPAETCPRGLSDGLCGRGAESCGIPCLPRGLAKFQQAKQVAWGFAWRILWPDEIVRNDSDWQDERRRERRDQSHMHSSLKLGRVTGQRMPTFRPGAAAAQVPPPSLQPKPPVLLLDVMDTLVVDPFWQMPAFFGMTFKEASGHAPLCLASCRRSGCDLTCKPFSLPACPPPAWCS